MFTNSTSLRKGRTKTPYSSETIVQRQNTDWKIVEHHDNSTNKGQLYNIKTKQQDDRTIIQQQSNRSTRKGQSYNVRTIIQHHDNRTVTWHLQYSICEWTTIPWSIMTIVQWQNNCTTTLIHQQDNCTTTQQSYNWLELESRLKNNSKNIRINNQSIQ